MLHGDGYFMWEAWHASLEDMYRDIDDDHSHSRKFGHKARRAVYNQFFEAAVPEDNSIPKNELHLMFGPKAFRGRNANFLAARAAFWSTRSYFVTPYELRREVFSEPGGRDEEYSLYMSDKFVALVVALKPYILDGCINVIPKASNLVNNESTLARLNAVNSNILSAFLHEEVSGVRRLEDASALRFLFQSVTGPRGQDIIKIRSEHQKELQAVQHALAGMLALDPLCGETVLLESMQVIEDGVHRLNDRLQRMRRNDWFKAMKLALTPLPFVVPLLSPQLSGIVRAATAMMGTTGVIDLVQYGMERRSIKEEIKNDPFFVPWLLSSSEPGSPRKRL